MNIREFMNNPSGKGAVIPGKAVLLMDLDKRYNELTKNDGISEKIYNHKDIYYFHIITKTESEERDNTYDVVLKFEPVDKNMLKDGSLKNYIMKVFSNSPSFTFTYAYVAGLNGILIEELMDKFDVNILGQPPISRNPSLLFSYEKTIYFACKYLLEHNKLNKSYLKGNSKPLKKEFFKNIRNYKQIEEEITRAKNKIKADKMNLKPDKPLVPPRPTYKNSDKSAGKIKNVNTIKKIGSTVKPIKPKKNSTSVKKIKKK